MVLPAQFQLGLELTNIVNPLGTALSHLSSLALIDAIKRSGSDIITEMKLASLIGRHRIDPVMEYSFKAVVAKSNQSVISRYIDIVLESGAGPTVQEALKNPALFSMVIQLSMLSVTHTDVSLSNAIVTAVENILRDAGASSERAPEYVSLIGTIRACQEQTALFRWAHLYDAVDHKIHRALTSWQEKQQHAKGESPKRSIYGRWRTETTGIFDRSLPFAVFQSLLMWLQSLQSFPEHRILHIRCDTGISTVVVWCHHLLGLNVTVRLDGVDTYFGQGMSNVFVEESTLEQAGASLLDAVDQNEPLFSLTKTEDDTLLTYEARAEAFGYGKVILKEVIDTDDELRYASHWIIGQVLQNFRSRAAYSRMLPLVHKDFNEERVLQAGKFLFALDDLDQELLELPRPPRPLDIEKECALGLLATLVTFARVHDLKNCMGMSLSLEVVRRYNTKSILGEIFNLRDCFDQLSRLLLGHRYSEAYIARAVLISGWGWSIFYSTVDATDPADVSTDLMRVMPGVPSRRGLRKARILDGPTDWSISGSESADFDRRGSTLFLPGISTAKRGPALIGYHGTDAFSITQSFEWRSIDGTKCQRKLGFRRMQDICSKFKILSSCGCEDVVTYGIDYIDRHTMDADITLHSDFTYHPTERVAPTLQNQNFEYAGTQDLEGQTEKALWYCHSTPWFACNTSHSPAVTDERFFMKHIIWAVGHEDPGIVGIATFTTKVTACCWYSYVAGNPAARWLQMAHFSSLDLITPLIHFLRGHNYCLACILKLAPAYPNLRNQDPSSNQESSSHVDKSFKIVL